MEESISEEDTDGKSSLSSIQAHKSLVSTEFFEWSCRAFCTPVMQMSEDADPNSDSHFEQEFRCLRAARIREQATQELEQASKSE